MKLTNIALLSLMSSFVFACGGGGGSSSETFTQTPVVVVEEPVVELPTEIDTVEPDPNAIYDTTAELIVSKSFLLEQSYELAISYKNEGSKSGYLSVCTEFTEGEKGIKINYNSCLLRTSIENDYAGSLKVANNKKRLVMAVWYLNEPKNPRYAIWENDTNAEGERRFFVN